MKALFFTFLCVILLLSINTVYSQSGTFTFSTATDNGNNVTETDSSVTLTVTSSGGPDLYDGNLDLGLSATVSAGPPQCYNSSGNTMTLTFSQAVNITTIRCMEGVGANFSWDFTPTGGSNTAVTNQAVNGNNGTTVTLNFIGITAITLTEHTGTFTDVFFGVDDIVMDGSLPVELTSFTALANNNSVILNWATATEVNNYGFNVARSSAALAASWETIGFVQGHGNSNSPKSYSFTDNSPIGGNVQYRLKQIDIDGTYKYYDPVDVTVNVEKFALNQNYPNPFNPVTTISYTIPQKAQVNLTVYDVLGREVTNLVNKQQESGVYNVQFNGSNLNSGIYFYELKAGNYSEVKKLLLVK